MSARGTTGGGTLARAGVATFAGGLLLAFLPAGPAQALPAVPTHYAVTARTPVIMTLTGLLRVDGAPAGAGVEIAVYDPNSVLCGASGVDAANGGAFVLHVYGDDPTTGADEGMAAGDALRFEVRSPAGPMHPQAELRFSAAPFGTAPPAYPPVFADRAAYSLNVSDNHPPVLAAIGPRTVDENTALSVTLSATDPDGDPLTFSAAGLPAGANFDPATRIFSWTPGYAQAGAYTATFTASDGALADSETVTFTVNNVNRAPVANAAVLAVTEDTPGTGTLTGSDPDGNPLTYSLVAGQGPQLGSVSITNPGTGAYTYTPNPNATGADSFAFRASDGSLVSNAATISVTIAAVNDPPVLAAIGNRTVNEGQLLAFIVSATDVEGDGLTFTAAPLPTGATFDPTTRTFSWTPGFTQGGNFAVTFTVTDDGSPPRSDSETITISVGAVNQPPVLAAIGPRSVDQGQLLAFTVHATDPNADPLSYAAGPLPGGASFDPATGAFAWTPQYGQEGIYAVTFTVADDGTPPLTDTETVAITVTPAIVTVSISLHAGWNLVSFPLALCAYTGATPPSVSLPQGMTCQPIASIGDFFSGIGGQFERIESFDAAGAHSFDPNLPSYVNDLTYVAGGYGYRIKMRQASVLTLTGRRLPPTSALSLDSGWTLAGFWGVDVRHTGTPPAVPFPSGATFRQVASIADVFAPSLGAAPAAVWSTDASGDHTHPTAVAPATPVTYVGPGYGYWIKVNTPADQDYDLPP